MSTTLSPDHVIAELKTRWGDGVITDPTELEYFGTDVYSQGKPLLAVLRPTSAEQIAAAVAELTAAGVTLIARGGGMSYTGGYLATRQPTVLIDTGGLDKVVEINVQDAYVVVEAGVTWEALQKALQAKGVRTPYFGPMSGSHATVGGALSQGSVFHGSARYGSSADSVLGLEVVTANGEILRTGSAASGNATPFFRWHGPDLTGVFLGDCGLLGIKVRASLRLLPRHSHIDYLSWQFERADQLMDAMGALARAGLASEIAAFDPSLSQIRMRRASLSSDVKSLGNVIKKGGLMQGLKLVTKGRDFLDPDLFTLHITLEGDSEGEISARVAAARKAVAAFGKEVENSVPKVMAANPFAAKNAMLGSAGERWAPIHGIVPHSRSTDLFNALQELFAAEKAVMDEHGLFIGTLMTTVGAQATLIEPCIYWPDSHNAFHVRTVDPEHRAKIGCPGENLPARAATDALKRKIADTMRAHGAASFQIGKFYTYREGRDPAALAMLDAIKQQLDPKGLMNPGVLGR
ncbi:FAD-binding oxidoreductase [Lysobacter sp. A03]|uniref:FAD-binding oxidoreductase n=1 Tax=Lysobacter sp. A03 TaxID=1199154 RepID=UPI0005B74D83|nr:FAD-binding oxidoreductase [Lysobacter sp. A03]KIQ96693.1 Glycolate dehydrogenase, subunit GlcD [Lysobacter sp. A03]